MPRSDRLIPTPLRRAIEVPPTTRKARPHYGTGLRYAHGFALHQLADRLAIIKDMHRSSAAVGEGLGRIDAKHAIDGAEHVLHAATAVARVFAAGAGSADGLAH